MGIFSRLADIINANIAALLERAEDPEKMVRLMIQEMEDTLVEVRAGVARGLADRKDVERQLRQVQEAQAEWRRKAELALDREREDLARAALLEKSKLAEAEALLREEEARLQEAVSKYDEDIRKLEVKLREAKSRQKAMLARQQTLSAQLKVRRQVHDRRLSDALARFEQMERRLDETEGQVEAFDLGREPGLDEAFAGLEAEGQVEEELRALRAKRAARAGEQR